MVAKKLVESIIGSEITPIGEDCTKAYNDMWENVSNAKQSKDDLGSTVNHQVTFRYHTRSSSSLWITYPRYHNLSMATQNYLFFGYVIAKSCASRSTQTIAETYEECVFRRFEPGFVSDFFKSFNKILCQRQRATMSYQPQANGFAERMDQTTTRALKMYVQDLDQRDWEIYVEWLTFAINPSRDRIQGETPFYMIHRWDSRSTLEAVIPVGIASMISIQEGDDIIRKSITNSPENTSTNVYA
ncbi:LOW QUALITY PROTEIN: reverse transcriptase [Phytophthora megakarya]|uniref:Reverse transcriptase n=1 Tax=Phytophthora megakarya TaxID=4795 RepID=A0A225WK08_9STRA|nr:LOW QUALITY PROTEIN: reverse transcriptase [Phytophthora megakarya]